MNSIKLTYINYLQIDKVYVFRFLRLVLHLLIPKRSGPVLIVTWWCFDESSVTRNGQTRPCGRNTLIEIDLIRLEAVFVEMLLYEMFCLCTRCRSSLKMLLKLASKIVELMTWTKYAGVLLSFVDRKWFWFCIYYEVF